MCIKLPRYLDFQISNFFHPFSRLLFRIWIKWSKKNRMSKFSDFSKLDSWKSRLNDKFITCWSNIDRKENLDSPPRTIFNGILNFGSLCLELYSRTISTTVITLTDKPKKPKKGRAHHMFSQILKLRIYKFFQVKVFYCDQKWQYNCLS